MRLLLISIFALLLASTTFAQSDRGTITGAVADPAGAVVPNAKVEARNVGTGVVYPAEATATGNYTISQLPAGTYEVSVTVPGFKKYNRSGLVLQVAQIMRIDATLEVGTASESVTVTEAASLLNTETAELSHDVPTKNMDDLPVLGIGATQAGSAGIRNPYAVTQLIPGTVWSADAYVRVNGAPNSTQSLRIEGMDASNSGTPGTAAMNAPSVDAIQEYAIQTSNFAAEYGQVGGGYFNATMKSGTNQFHGSAYDYFVNEVFNAGTPYTAAAAGTGNPRARNRRTDYGFTLGGPVWIPKIYNGHDKTFFFFNWEQYREHVDINNQLETVPTAAYLAGNFATSIPPGSSPIGTDPLGRPIFAGEIYDPNTQRAAPTGQIVRDPFPNQTISPSRLDPIAAKIQTMFPAPMGPFATGVVNNFEPNIPTSRITEVPSVKLDQTIGAKGKLSFFFQRTKTSAPLSFTFGMVDGLPDPLDTNRGTFITAPLYRLNYDHTVSPTLLLHFGGGFRATYFFDPTINEEGNVPNYNAQQQLGLNGGTTHIFFPDFSGLCVAGPGTGSCTGQGGMQIFGSSFYATAYTQSATFNHSVVWVKRNHTYKFGAEFRTEGYPSSGLTGTSGQYVFAADQTSLPYLNGTTLAGQTPGFGYASFLLGAVKQVTVTNPVVPRKGKNQTGIYAQDSWKISRRLTFDYGLRYDYSTYLREEHGRMPDFSPTVLNPAVGNIPGGVIFEGNLPGHCDCDFAKNYPFAVSPRLGLAFQINSKTVFRSGFGIVYNGTEANDNASGGSSSNTVPAPSFGAAITTLAVGIPASYNPPLWPNLAPGQFNTTPTPVAPGAEFIDENAGRPARQYQWSAGFQRQILRDLAVDVSYVGNRGIWWYSPGLINLNAIPVSRLNAVGININNPTQAALLPMPLNSASVVQLGLGSPPYPGFPVTQSLGQALRPFPQFTTISSYWNPLGDTWYNAMQVKTTKRLSHGLSFVSTFTWAKSLDIASESGDPLTGANGVVNDVFNRKNQKTYSAYDQPFKFNISLGYTTPKVSGNKILSWIARDWTYGAFLQYASGFPIPVPTANNNMASTVFQSTLADRVPGQPLFTVNLNCHCYNPNTTFALNPAAWVNPPAGQFGTSAPYYSGYRYQRQPVENMNLGRSWRVHERYAFNLRMEFTDVFNRGHWANPTASNAQAPQTRLANGDTASGFGYINATAGAPPRNGLLVGRFTF
ncbi:MAG TPA: TonB-dependent receptor [Bryobacteraceae bacterium]